MIDEINLDFQTNIFSTLNSSHPSPLIERVNINNIFSNAMSCTRPSILDCTIYTDLYYEQKIFFNLFKVYNSNYFSAVLLKAIYI